MIDRSSTKQNTHRCMHACPGAGAPRRVLYVLLPFWPRARGRARRDMDGNRGRARARRETWELERWARARRAATGGGARAGGPPRRGVRVRARTRAWRGDSAPARTWRHMSAHAHACTHAAATTETARCKIKAIDMISIHGR